MQRVGISLLILGALAQNSQASAQEARPVSLTQAQRSSLMQETCDAHGTSGRAEIRAWRMNPQRAGIRATALCPSLQRVRSLPTFRKYTCNTANGKPWTCEESLHAVRITVDTRKVLVTYKSGLMSPAIAMEITRYIGAEHPLTFNGHNLREMMLEGECQVSPLGPGALPESTNYLLGCGLRQLIVGRLCMNTRCNNFPISYEEPTP
jgi:hypothetical protein